MDTRDRFTDEAQFLGIVLNEELQNQLATDNSNELKKVIYQSIDQLDEKDEHREKLGLDINQVVLQSPFKGLPPAKLPAEVVKMFNQDVQDIIVEPKSFRSGKRIGPDQFYLAERNKVTKIEIGNGRRLNVKFNLNFRTDIREIGVFNQNLPLIGDYGSYVINVPPGKYFKAWSGNNPLFLGEGVHVRHDPLFRFEENRPLDYQGPAILKRLLPGLPELINSFDAKLHVVDQSDLYMHQGNIHILRVQPGSFAQITLNGKPYLLPPRKEPYVYQTPRFVFNPNKDFKDQSNNYIAHGNFHLLRVPPGKLAKVIINNTPLLLPPTKQNVPYIIENPNFVFEGSDLENGDRRGLVADIKHAAAELKYHAEKLFDSDEQGGYVNATANYIHHQTIHRVRVPPGKFAKVIVDGIPEILEPLEGNKPHCYNTSNFQFNPKTDYVNQSESYINHGTRHILRLQKGKVAKAWWGNNPEILEENHSLDTEAKDAKKTAQEQSSEPVVMDFRDAQFRLQGHERDEKNYFWNADEKLIIHGSIKRVITPINELAIINNNGALELRSGKFTINSPSTAVVDFFDTSLQTLEFPSEKTKSKRQKESGYSSLESKVKASDRIIYDVYTTSDSVEVGIKLLVAFRVPNVECATKALTSFKTMENIKEHIEGVVRSDMTKIIKQYTSQKFNAPSEKDTKSGLQNKSEDKSSGLPASSPYNKTYLELAEEVLKEHLDDSGIKLIRMTIEESKILNTELSDRLSTGALTTAKTNADLAIQEQQTLIQKAGAEREKTVAVIKQSQESENIVIAAQARLKVAEFESLAQERKAEAAGRAIERTATADAKAITVKGAAQNEILLQQAKFYEENPRLFELEMSKTKYKALEKVSITVTSQEFSNLFNIPGLSLFSGYQNKIHLPTEVNNRERDDKEVIVEDIEIQERPTSLMHRK